MKNQKMLMSIKIKENFGAVTFKNNQDINIEAKKRAKQHLLVASRLIEFKKYDEARDELVYAVDGCLLIQPPDQQSKKLIYLCCEYIALIKKKEATSKNDHFQDSYERLILQNRKRSRHKLFVLQFDKQIGEFIFRKQDKNTVHQDLKFYVSRLNYILFQHNNIQTEKSIIGMLNTYKFAFFLLVLLLIALVFLLTSQLIQNLFLTNIDSISYDLPIIIGALSFVFPLMIVYYKEPDNSHKDFFYQKLGKQICKINEQHDQKVDKITFHLDKTHQQKTPELRIILEQQQVFKE